MEPSSRIGTKNESISRVYAQLYGMGTSRFTIIIEHRLRRKFLCVRRFIQIQITVSWNLNKKTAFENHPSGVSPHRFHHFLLQYVYCSSQ